MLRVGEELAETRQKLETSEERCSSHVTALEQVNLKLDDQDSTIEELNKDIQKMDAQHEAKLDEFTRLVVCKGVPEEELWPRCLRFS